MQLFKITLFFIVKYRAEHAANHRLAPPWEENINKQYQLLIRGAGLNRFSTAQNYQQLFNLKPLFFFNPRNCCLPWCLLTHCTLSIEDWFPLSVAECPQIINKSRDVTWGCLLLHQSYVPMHAPPGRSLSLLSCMCTSADVLCMQGTIILSPLPLDET